MFVVCIILLKNVTLGVAFRSLDRTIGICYTMLQKIKNLILDFLPQSLSGGLDGLSVA